MQKLILLSVFVLSAFLLRAQDTIQPANTGLHVGLNLFAGLSSVYSHNVLFPVPGELRGVKNIEYAPHQYQLNAGVDLGFGRFHAGLNISAAFCNFDVAVHRYQVFYSPGGNQWGGDIYANYTGYFMTYGFAPYAEYYFWQKAQLQLGAHAGASANVIPTVHYREYSVSASSVYTSQFSYYTLDLGPALLWTPKSVSIFVKPYAQYVAKQTFDMFTSWNGGVRIGITYHPKNY